MATVFVIVDGLVFCVNLGHSLQRAFRVPSQLLASNTIQHNALNNAPLIKDFM